MHGRVHERQGPIIRGYESGPEHQLPSMAKIEGAMRPANTAFASIETKNHTATTKSGLNVQIQPIKRRNTVIVNSENGIPDFSAYMMARQKGFLEKATHSGKTGVELLSSQGLHGS